jgi:hypothetical protein
VVKRGGIKNEDLIFPYLYNHVSRAVLVTFAARVYLNRRQLTKQGLDDSLLAFQKSDLAALKKDPDFARIIRMREFRDQIDARDQYSFLRQVRNSATELVRLTDCVDRAADAQSWISAALNSRKEISLFFAACEMLKKSDTGWRWARAEEDTMNRKRLEQADTKRVKREQKAKKLQEKRHSKKQKLDSNLPSSSPSLPVLHTI